MLVIKELDSTTDLSVHATYASSDNEPHLRHENMQHILYLLGVGTVMQLHPVDDLWDIEFESILPGQIGTNGR